MKESERIEALSLVSSSELSNIIDEWVKGRHAQRNKAIMKRRMIDGICFEPLAEEFDLSVRHIKTIVYSLEYTIYKHL